MPARKKIWRTRPGFWAALRRDMPRKYQNRTSQHPRKTGALNTNGKKYGRWAGMNRQARSTPIAAMRIKNSAIHAVHRDAGQSAAGADCLQGLYLGDMGCTR